MEQQYSIIEFIWHHMKEDNLFRQSFKIGDEIIYHEQLDRKRAILEEFRNIHLPRFYDFEERKSEKDYLFTIFTIIGLKLDYNQ